MQVHFQKSRSSLYVKVIGEDQDHKNKELDVPA